MKFGDIISFRQGQNIITHRISEINEEDGKILYKTKGDNNNAEDSGEIDISLIEGKVANTLPAIGKLVIALQGKTVIIVVLFLMWIYIANRNSKKKKRRERREKRLEYERYKRK